MTAESSIQTFKYTLSDNGNFNDIEVNLIIGAAFKPTTTSNLLLRSIGIHEGGIVIDMGCGIGGSPISLAKYFPVSKVYAVDKQEEACNLARENIERHNLSEKIEVIHSDLFKELEGIKADIILDDVSGISNYQDFARKTTWYSEKSIPVADDDGSYPTTEMLEQSVNYLKDNGKLYFPVLSLARESKILEKAESMFRNVEKLNEYSLPLSKHCFTIDFEEAGSLIEEMKEKGIIRLEKRGSRYLWNLGIYKASIRR